MFFLVSFAWLVAASFAFLLAILTPNWLTFIPPGAVSNTTVRRGIFYVCDTIPTTDASEATRCLSIIQQGASTDPNKWIYEFATACLSLAIACISLSVIALWLSGLYFQAQRRNKSMLWALLCISILILLIFATSFIVWILLISEAIKLGLTIDRFMFNWPMWVAVGATGGYLISFITTLFSYCAIRRRETKREENYYPTKNQF